MALTQVNLTAPLETIRFAVPDMFPLGFPSFIGAREGVGKTTILAGLLWQMSRPNGGEFLGFRVAHGSSIYVNTDAPDGESRTVRHWLEKHKAAYPDGDLSKISVLEPNQDGNLTESDMLEIAENAVLFGVKVIVIDSYMGAFGGVDNNRLEQALKPMFFIRGLATKTGAAVIVTDHIPKRMAGEKDGDRGIMGSVAKSAQARAVHILSRVDPKECDGQNTLRWEVHKQSFAQRLEPFGVRLVLEGDDQDPAYLVRVERCDLPNSENNGQDKAEKAVTRFLEARAGETFSRKELLEVAISGGNIKERWADEAMRKAFGGFADRLETIKGIGKGAPLSYRLKPLPAKTDDSSQDDLMQSLPFHAVGTASNVNTSITHKTDFMQSEVRARGTGDTLAMQFTTSNAKNAVIDSESFHAVVSARNAPTASNDLTVLALELIRESRKVNPVTLYRELSFEHGASQTEIQAVLESLEQQGAIVRDGQHYVLPMAKSKLKQVGATLTPELETRFLALRPSSQADKLALPNMVKAAKSGDTAALERLYELEAATKVKASA